MKIFNKNIVLLYGVISALCLVILPSCSLIKVSEIPDPFSGDIVFGKVIGEIKLEGLKYTKKYVVERSMASKVGQVYTKETAVLDRKRLSQLGIFTSVQFSVIGLDDKIILIVNLMEVSPYIPAPSFKITDENGLEIGVSLSSPNLFGSASNLSAWIRGGGATNVGARFKYPWYPGAGWWSGHQADYFHLERYNKIYEFNENSDQLNLIYLPNIVHNLRLGPQVSYLSLKSDQPDITLDTDNRDKIPGIGLSLQFDSRNLRTYATDGWWSELLVSYYGGNAHYWQGNLDIRRYFKIGSAHNSLTCYSLFTLTSGKVGSDIPEYLQFNIGGTNSVRGWDLGAREGKNQFINTIEYWHFLIKPKSYKIWVLKQMLALQGALFLDAGAAWTGKNDFNKNWILGGGIGLRLITALGVTLRFDVSIGQRDLRFGLNIGSGEKAVAQRDRVR